MQSDSWGKASCLFVRVKPSRYIKKLQSSSMPTHNTHAYYVKQFEIILAASVRGGGFPRLFTHSLGTKTSDVAGWRAEGRGGLAG